MIDIFKIVNHAAARRGIHYGWLMVAVAFVLILVSAGVRSAPAILIKPLEEDFGWGRGDLSLALSVSILMLGLAGPVSGKMIDRRGLRFTTLLFLGITVIGIVLSATLAHLWQMYLYWGLLVGFGTGGVSIVLSAAVANTWFESQRGLVTGILGGASSAGQFVFLQLLLGIETSVDWRAAVWVLALLMGVVVLPLTFLVFRSRPSDVGLDPYRAKGVAPAPPSAHDLRLTPMSEALRTTDFWLLSVSFGICGFTTIGLIGTHFIPHATEHGFSEAQAAGILSLMGLMNIVGTVSSGWLTDRYDPRKLLAIYYTLRAASLMVLPLITTLPLMSGFAIIFGLDFIATVPPTVMLTANRFGRRSVGTIYGWITFAHMAGGALAAAFAGLIHDVAGDYAVAIYLAGFTGLVAAALAWKIRMPHPALPASQSSPEPSPAQ